MSGTMDTLQKELPKLKAALTRAKNSKDPHKVLAAASAGLRRFEEIGFPDSWHSEQEDAEEQLREHGDIEGHIFTRLVTVDNWLDGVNKKAEDYFDLDAE